MLRERIAFVGQENIPEEFLKRAKFTPITVPISISIKNRPMYIFQEYLRILESRQSYIIPRHPNQPIRIDDSGNIEDKEPEFFWVIEDDQEGFLRSARDIMKTRPDEIFSFGEQLDLKDFFSSLILIRLNTQKASDARDEETNIRVVRITEKDIHESQDHSRMHPTPNS